MPRRLDRIIHRLQEKAEGLRIAILREPPKVEQWMIKIPAVDGIGVLVVANIGEIAPQRLQLGIPEFAETGLELGFERMRRAAPFAPVMDRLDDRHLHHDVGIFGGGVRVDVAMCIVADGRLGRFVEIAQRLLSAQRPVAKLGRRQVEELIGAAEQLEKVARPVALVARPVRAAEQDRIGQDDFLAGRERLDVVLAWRRDRKQQAERRPLAADNILGLRICRAAIIIERGQIWK